jgi:hypothetical protein
MTPCGTDASSGVRSLGMGQTLDPHCPRTPGLCVAVRHIWAAPIWVAGHWVSALLSGLRQNEPVAKDSPLVFIGRQSDHLAITAVGRMHPGATDYWDGNWLTTSIEFQVGDFSGQINAALRTNELAEFRAQLVTLYETLKGEARLDSIEDWLAMTFEGDGAGHVSVSGAMRDQPGVGNTVQFTFNLDQTYLPSILDQLEEIDREFPIIR